MKIKEEDKDLNYWKNNCEENYMTTPISVLRYITELEKVVNNVDLDDVIKCNHDFKPTTMGGEFDGNKCIHCGEYEDLT